MSDLSKSQQMEFETFGKNPKPDYSYLNRLQTGPSAQIPPINVVFSHQSVIILLICVLLSLVVSFTLGVEKGKLLARNSLPRETAAYRSAPAGTPALASITAPPETQPIETRQEATALPENKNTAAMTFPAENAAAAKKEAAPASLSGYAIQIASVKSAEAAKNLTGSLIKKGVPSFTKTSGKYIVVLAGNFSKKEEAQFNLKELKKTYTDCFIRKI